MNSMLGSRRRFLSRLILYGLAPWVGLFVFLAHPDEVEGRLLGVLGIAVGAFALSALWGRLVDPWEALRYALRPVHTVVEAVHRWRAERSEGPSSQQIALEAHLRHVLPDVEIRERRTPAGTSALILGDELLVCLSAPPTTPDEVGALAATLEDLRAPLCDEPVILVLMDETPDALDLSALGDEPRTYLVRPSG